MDLATSLLIMTLPNGGKMVVGGFPVPTAECHTFTMNNRDNVRGTAVCVHSPVWIVNKRYWRLAGNRIIFKPGKSSEPLTSPSVTSAASTSAKGP